MKTICGICLAVGSGVALRNIFGMEWACIDLVPEIFSGTLHPLSCALSPLVYWGATGIAAAIGWNGLSMALTRPRRRVDAM